MSVMACVRGPTTGRAGPRGCEEQDETGTEEEKEVEEEELEAEEEDAVEEEEEEKKTQKQRKKQEKRMGRESDQRHAMRKWNVKCRRRKKRTQQEG